jgi:hypothetical protein
MENFSLPPREHKKVNYAEFEAFSDSSSENNKKQNHGNYISWSSSEDALLIEQVNKYLEIQKNENETVQKENKEQNIDANMDKNSQIDNLTNNEKDEKNNINLNKEKNLLEKSPEDKKDKEISPILNINWNKISEKFVNKNAVVFNKQTGDIEYDDYYFMNRYGGIAAMVEYNSTNISNLWDINGDGTAINDINNPLVRSILISNSIFQ